MKALQNLRQILKTISQDVEVLPAVGGAVEDLERPDFEEREDQALNEEEKVFETIFERDPSGTRPPLYRPVPAVERTENHLFRYFLDDSFRSYFLGTVLENERESPVHYAQIGACVLRREDDGSVRREVLQGEGSESEDLPEKVIIFVDELNKYAPAREKESPIIEQVLDIAERGRSLEVVLLGAEQFMSAVHDRVVGNCSTTVIGRSGSAELASSAYRFLDPAVKANVSRLQKGELVASHATFRQPVKIRFPRPAYWQEGE